MRRTADHPIVCMSVLSRFRAVRRSTTRASDPFSRIARRMARVMGQALTFAIAVLVVHWLGNAWPCLPF